MKGKHKKTHWLKAIGDYRYEALEEIFNGFEKALENFKKKIEENEWYDGGNYKDETELIYGVVLVALQNYINSSCIDFIKIEGDNKKKKFEYYSLNSNIINNGVTQIRLINELANFFKHKDEKTNLHTNTRDCFSNLDLLKYTLDDSDYSESDLITEGLFVLCPGGYSIKELLPIVKLWRDKIIDSI